MCPPRCIRSGQTWMVTRRTTRRHFLLRPDVDGVTQQIYWYTTAVLARKFGIELHAVQVMSTHMHEVLTDVRGNLPAFIRERNRALANALKCHRGWPEEVFQRAPANCIQLFGTGAVVKEIAYTLANCVKAGLVDDPARWPGVGVTSEDIGVRTVRVRRPTMYFDPQNPVWPEEAEIAITMPSSVTTDHGADAALVVRAAIRVAVDEAREAIRKAGRTFTTIADIFAVAFVRRSNSFETYGKRVPSFATGGDAQYARAARDQRREFLGTYRKAFSAMKRGDPFQFPEGTWRWLVELLPPRRSASTPATAQRFQCQTVLPESDSSWSTESP